jgi:hypothetical protein
VHGGELSLTSGAGGVNSGEVVISSSPVGKQATGGDVELSSGSANAIGASSGAVTIASGNALDTEPGTVRLIGGSSDLGKGASVHILAGEGVSSGLGGSLSLRKFWHRHISLDQSFHTSNSCFFTLSLPPPILTPPPQRVAKQVKRPSNLVPQGLATVVVYLFSLDPQASEEAETLTLEPRLPPMECNQEQFAF